MAITRTGYMDHEAGEVLIGQGYAVSVVEFTEGDGSRSRRCGASPRV
jgi:hypothetical protein